FTHTRDRKCLKARAGSSTRVDSHSDVHGSLRTLVRALAQNPCCGRSWSMRWFPHPDENQRWHFLLRRSLLSICFPPSKKTLANSTLDRRNGSWRGASNGANAPTLDRLNNEHASALGIGYGQYSVSRLCSLPRSME